MSLPGKLCIGILEEDNPLKAYFRFKPLLVAEGSRYVPFEEAAAYPEEGCIRIVPDKNESYHFKIRMRRMGLFCVVDLRNHPETNDKIRPNKNFREGSPEQNAFIIYSDVVREPAPQTIFEVLPQAEPDAPRPFPHTAQVLVRGDAPSPERYDWEAVPGTVDRARLVATGKRFAPEAIQLFELTGFRGEALAFGIVPPAGMPATRLPQEARPFGPEAERHGAGEAKDEPLAEPVASEAKPEAPAQPGTMPDGESAPEVEDSLRPGDAGITPSQREALENEAAAKAAPLCEGGGRSPEGVALPEESGRGPGSVAPEESAAPEAEHSLRPGDAGTPPSQREALKDGPAAQAAPFPEGAGRRPEGGAPARPVSPRQPDKPWIHRDASMLPRPVDPRLSPAQRSLAAQSGMNPRRGRSLQELIDEKWQQSRLNQLGQPVAPIQTGAPLSSPVDSAVSAVRDVWNQPQLRRALLESLGGIEEFGASLEECREAARQRDIEAHLENLEARRLALLGELDRLTKKSSDVRQALKQELRQEAEGEAAEADRRAKAAQAEQAKYEALAEEARAAAQDARKAVDALTGEELERHLREFALTEHMLERIRLIKGEAEAVPPVAPWVEVVDLNALAARLTARYEAEGYAITRIDALNLCACAAISPVLLLSGPVGCGKSEAARLLGEALGWSAVGRYARFAPGKGSLADDAHVKALDELPDMPALLLLDDANLYPAPDPLRALEAVDRPQWRLCLTLQDGGAPLSAHALDRGFLVRLIPRQDAPWKPRAKATYEAPAPASLCLAIPDVALPAAVEARLNSLREMLARRGALTSLRALNDIWRYCALMLDALGEHADAMRLLDRAVAQRLLPALLASAPVDTLRQLPALLDELPASRALLRHPLPVQI